MQFPAHAAMWFLPFVLPLCYAVALTDLRGMRIPNWAVDSLGVIFILGGALLMPTWVSYGWQLLHLPVGIALGFLFYAAGAVGAGDAKFAGAAAPSLSSATCDCCWSSSRRCCWRALPPTGSRNTRGCASWHRIGKAGRQARASPWACASARRWLCT